MSFLLRVLLLLAHLLYSFCETTRSLWFLTKRRYWRFRHPSDDVSSTKIILEHNRSLKRLPKHLALILGPEEPSFFDLARLLTWCIITGIPYVTFYDNNGFLKENGRTIKEIFSKQMPSLEEHVEWDIDKSAQKTKNGKNGIKHKTRVQCLSYEDGKEEIIAVTKNLAKTVLSGTMKIEEITIGLINDMLTKNGIPEPDAAIVCGKTMCTYGFLPWHTRVTEFFLLPTHHDFTVNEFLDILNKYNKCQQRYGK